MPTLTSKQVVGVCASILQATGAPAEEARTVGELLMRANLHGVDSHGIQNLTYYVSLIKDGLTKPGAKMRVAKETQSIALIDGGWNFGQVIATKAMRMAIEKGKKMGVGSVGIYNCGHIGRCAEYPMMALEQNMIGVLFANCDSSVAPWGGRRPMLGTNPVSFALPAGKERPIVVDYATAAVAEGKIRAAFLRGDKIPEGWILDKDGKPSTNPADLFEPPLPPVQVKVAGAQLPMAGHKGFGLGLVVDILGGALTGAGCDGDVKMGNGVFLEAINVESFISLKNYQAAVDKLIRDIKASPKAPGVTEILMPGEPELKSAEKRSRDGIPIPDATWAGIANVAKELRVDLDKVLKSAI